VSLSDQLPPHITRYARTIVHARIARFTGSHGLSKRWLERSLSSSGDEEANYAWATWTINNTDVHGSRGHLAIGKFYAIVQLIELQTSLGSSLKPA
jgi:hypothetical protein